MNKMWAPQTANNKGRCKRLPHWSSSRASWALTYHNPCESFLSLLLGLCTPQGNNQAHDEQSILCNLSKISGSSSAKKSTTITLMNIEKYTYTKNLKFNQNSVKHFTSVTEKLLLRTEELGRRESCKQGISLKRTVKLAVWKAVTVSLVQWLSVLWVVGHTVRYWTKTLFIDQTFGPLQENL